MTDQRQKEIEREKSTNGVADSLSVIRMTTEGRVNYSPLKGEYPDGGFYESTPVKRIERSDKRHA